MIKILIILLIICCALAFYFKHNMNKEIEHLANIKKERSGILLFQLEKTAPFGLGTTYHVSVYNNGEVTYNGPNNTSKSNYKPGYFEFILTKKEIKQIKKLLNKINIDDLENFYDCDVTDSVTNKIKDTKGTNLITFLHNNTMKMVNARCNFPKELGDLIGFTDEIIRNLPE